VVLADPSKGMSLAWRFAMNVNFSLQTIWPHTVDPGDDGQRK
jgi:hypothetical protein